jgi:hypothetical protein
MAVNIIITLTSVGADASTEYNLFSNIDGFLVPYETGVTLVDLQASYTSSAPNGTTTVRVCGTGPKCKSCIDIQATYTTTTTSTTTIAPITTTTTTTIAPITTTTSTTQDLSNTEAGISNVTETISACGLPIVTTVYIDASIPGTLSTFDVIYTDPSLTTIFVGNSRYYAIEYPIGAGAVSVPVNSSGVVGSPISSCITTTTTTTT